MLACQGFIQIEISVSHEKMWRNGVKYFKDPKAFMKYSNDVNGVCKSIGKYSPSKEQKVLLVFDEMIADIISNKKRHPGITGLFFMGRKLNISSVFITESYFRIVSSWIFQTNKSLNKLLLIFHLILTSMNL